MENPTYFPHITVHSKMGMFICQQQGDSKYTDVKNNYIIM